MTSIDSLAKKETETANSVNKIQNMYSKFPTTTLIKKELPFERSNLKEGILSHFILVYTEFAGEIKREKK